MTKGAGIDTYDLLHIKTIKDANMPAHTSTLDFFANMNNKRAGDPATTMSVDEYLSHPDVKKALHAYEEVGDYSTVNDAIF